MFFMFLNVCVWSSALCLFNFVLEFPVVIHADAQVMTEDNLFTPYVSDLSFDNMKDNHISFQYDGNMNETDENLERTFAIEINRRDLIYKSLVYLESITEYGQNFTDDIDEGNMHPNEDSVFRMRGNPVEIFTVL